MHIFEKKFTFLDVLDCCAVEQNNSVSSEAVVCIAAQSCLNKVHMYIFLYIKQTSKNSVQLSF